MKAQPESDKRFDAKKYPQLVMLYTNVLLSENANASVDLLKAMGRYYDDYLLLLGSDFQNKLPKTAQGLVDFLSNPKQGGPYVQIAFWAAFAAQNVSNEKRGGTLTEKEFRYHLALMTSLKDRAQEAGWFAGPFDPLNPDHVKRLSALAALVSFRGVGTDALTEKRLLSLLPYVKQLNPTPSQLQEKNWADLLGRAAVLQTIESVLNAKAQNPEEAKRLQNNLDTIAAKLVPAMKAVWPTVSENDPAFAQLLADEVETLLTDTVDARVNLWTSAAAVLPDVVSLRGKALEMTRSNRDLLLHFSRGVRVELTNVRGETIRFDLSGKDLLSVMQSLREDVVRAEGADAKLEDWAIQHVASRAIGFDAQRVPRILQAMPEILKRVNRLEARSDYDEGGTQSLLYRSEMALIASHHADFGLAARLQLLDSAIASRVRARVMTTEDDVLRFWEEARLAQSPTYRQALRSIAAHPLSGQLSPTQTLVLVNVLAENPDFEKGMSRSLVDVGVSAAVRLKMTAQTRLSQIGRGLGVISQVLPDVKRIDVEPEMAPGRPTRVAPTAPSRASIAQTPKRDVVVPAREVTQPVFEFRNPFRRVSRATSAEKKWSMGTVLGVSVGAWAVVILPKRFRNSRSARVALNLLGIAVAGVGTAEMAQAQTQSPVVVGTIGSGPSQNEILRAQTTEVQQHLGANLASVALLEFLYSQDPYTGSNELYLGYFNTQTNLRIPSFRSSEKLTEEQAISLVRFVSGPFLLPNGKTINYNLSELIVNFQEASQLQDHVRRNGGWGREMNVLFGIDGSVFRQELYDIVTSPEYSFATVENALILIREINRQGLDGAFRSLNGFSVAYSAGGFGGVGGPISVAERLEFFKIFHPREGKYNITQYLEGLNFVNQIVANEKRRAMFYFLNGFRLDGTVRPTETQLESIFKILNPRLDGLNGLRLPDGQPVPIPNSLSGTPGEDYLNALDRLSDLRALVGKGYGSEFALLHHNINLLADKLGDTATDNAVRAYLVGLMFGDNGLIPDVSGFEKGLRGVRVLTEAGEGVLSALKFMEGIDLRPGQLTEAQIKRFYGLFSPNTDAFDRLPALPDGTRVPKPTSFAADPVMGYFQALSRVADVLRTVQANNSYEAFKLLNHGIDLRGVTSLADARYDNWRTYLYGSVFLSDGSAVDAQQLQDALNLIGLFQQADNGPAAFQYFYGIEFKSSQALTDKIYEILNPKAQDVTFGKITIPAPTLGKVDPVKHVQDVLTVYRLHAWTQAENRSTREQAFGRLFYNINLSKLDNNARTYLMGVLNGPDAGTYDSLVQAVSLVARLIDANNGLDAFAFFHAYELNGQIPLDQLKRFFNIFKPQNQKFSLNGVNIPELTEEPVYDESKYVGGLQAIYAIHQNVSRLSRGQDAFGRLYYKIDITKPITDDNARAYLMGLVLTPGYEAGSIEKLVSLMNDILDRGGNALKAFGYVNNLSEYALDGHLDPTTQLPKLFEILNPATGSFNPAQYITGIERLYTLHFWVAADASGRRRDAFKNLYFNFDLTQPIASDNARTYLMGMVLTDGYNQADIEQAVALADRLSQGGEFREAFLKLYGFVPNGQLTADQLKAFFNIFHPQEGSYSLESFEAQTVRIFRYLDALRSTTLNIGGRTWTGIQALNYLNGAQVPATGDLDAVSRDLLTKLLYKQDGTPSLAFQNPRKSVENLIHAAAFLGVIRATPQTASDFEFLTGVRSAGGLTQAQVEFLFTFLFDADGNELPAFSDPIRAARSIEWAATLLRTPAYLQLRGIPRSFQGDLTILGVVFNEVANWVGPGGIKQMQGLNRYQEIGFNSVQEYALFLSRSLEVKTIIEGNRNLLFLMNEGNPFYTRYNDPAGLQSQDGRYLFDLTSMIGSGIDSPVQFSRQLKDILQTAVLVRPYAQELLKVSNLQFDAQTLNVDHLRENDKGREFLFRIAGEFRNRGIDRQLGMDRVVPQDSLRPSLGSLRLSRLVETLRSKGYSGPVDLQDLPRLFRVYGVGSDNDIQSLRSIRFAMSKRADLPYEMSFEAARVLDVILVGAGEVQKYQYRVSVEGPFSTIDRRPARVTAEKVNPYTQEMTEERYADGFLRSRKVIDMTMERETRETIYTRDNENSASFIETVGSVGTYKTGSERVITARSPEWQAFENMTGPLSAHAFGEVLRVEEYDRTTNRYAIRWMTRGGDLIAEETAKGIASVVTEAGVGAVRETWQVNADYQRVAKLTTARELPYLHSDASRRGWMRIEVTDHARGSVEEEIRNGRGELREVHNARAGEFAVVESDKLGREQRRRIYATRGARTQLREVTRIGFDSDGNVELRVQDLLRHQTAEETLNAAGRIIERTVGNETTRYDGTKIDWPIETFDNRTGRVIRRHQVITDAAELATFGVKAPAGVDLSFMSSGLVRTFDLTKTGTATDAWSDVTLHRNGRLEQRWVFQGEAQTHSVIRYGENNVETGAELTLLNKSGDVVGRKTVSDIRWEANGTGHSIETDRLTGSRVAKVVDAAGNAMAEYTLDQPNHLLTLVQRDDRGSETGRRTMALARGVSIDPAKATLQALQVYELNFRDARLINGSGAPDYQADGTVKVRSWVAVIGEGLREVGRDFRDDVFVGDRLLSRTQNGLTTFYDTAKPYLHPRMTVRGASETDPKVKTYSVDVDKEWLGLGRIRMITITENDLVKHTSTSAVYDINGTDVTADLEGWSSRTLQTVDGLTVTTTPELDPIFRLRLAINKTVESREGQETSRIVLKGRTNEGLDFVEEENVTTGAKIHQILRKDETVAREATLHKTHNEITFYADDGSAKTYRGYNAQGYPLGTVSEGLVQQMMDLPLVRQTAAPRHNSDGTITIQGTETQFVEDKTNAKGYRAAGVMPFHETLNSIGRLQTKLVNDQFKSDYNTAWSIPTPAGAMTDTRSGRVVETYRLSWNRDAGGRIVGTELTVTHGAQTWMDTYTVRDGLQSHVVLGTENGKAAREIGMPVQAAQHGIEIGFDVSFELLNGSEQRILRARDRKIAFDDTSKAGISRHENIANDANNPYSTEDRYFNGGGDLIQIVTQSRITAIDPDARTSKTYARVNSQTLNRGELLVESTMSSDGRSRSDRYWLDHGYVRGPIQARTEKVNVNAFGRVESFESLQGSDRESGVVLYQMGLESGQQISARGSPVRVYGSYSYAPGKITRFAQNLLKFDAHSEVIDLYNGRTIQENRGDFSVQVEYTGSSLRRVSSRLFKQGSSRPMQTWNSASWVRYESVKPLLNLTPSDEKKLGITAGTLLAPNRVSMAWGERYTEYAIVGDFYGRTILTRYEDGSRLLIDNFLPNTNMATLSRLVSSQNAPLKQYRARPVKLSDYIRPGSDAAPASIRQSLAGAGAVEIEELNDRGNLLGLRSKWVGLFQFVSVGSIRAGLMDDGRTMDLAPGATLDLVRYAENDKISETPNDIRWVKDGQDTYELENDTVGRKIFYSELMPRRRNDVWKNRSSEEVLRSLSDSLKDKHRPTADALQVDRAEVYTVNAVDRQNRTVKTYETIYVANRDQELARIDVDRKRVSVKFYEGLVETSGIDFRYEDSQATEELGLSVALDPYGIQNAGRRPIFVLDKKTKLGFVETRDANDGAILTRDDGEFDPRRAERMQFRDTQTFKKDVKYNQSAPMTDGRVNALMVELRNGNWEGVRNDLHGENADFHQVSQTRYSYKEHSEPGQDLLSSVFLRRMGIPHHSETRLWIDRSPKELLSAQDLDSAGVSSISDIQHLQVLPTDLGGIRIEVLQADRVLKEHYRKILEARGTLSSAEIEEIVKKPVDPKYTVTVRDGAGRRTETWHGQLRQDSRGVRSFTPEMKFYEFYFFKEDRDRPETLKPFGEYGIANKSIVTIVQNGQEYLHGVSNSVDVDERGHVIYAAQRGITHRSLAVTATRPDEVYRDLRRQLLNNQLQLDGVVISNIEEKNNRGYLAASRDGYRHDQIETTGYVKQSERNKPAYVTFYTYASAGAPDLLLFHVGLATNSRKYEQVGERTDRYAYENFETDKGWLARGESWILEAKNVRLGTHQFKAAGEATPIIAYEVTSRQPGREGKVEIANRWDGSVIFQTSIGNIKVEAPWQRTYYDRFGIPHFVTAWDPTQKSLANEPNKEVLYARVSTAFGPREFMWVYTRPVDAGPFDSRPRLEAFHFEDQILLWRDLHAQGEKTEKPALTPSPRSSYIDKPLLLPIEKYLLGDPDRRAELEDIRKEIVRNPDSIVNALPSNADIPEELEKPEKINPSTPDQYDRQKSLRWLRFLNLFEDRQLELPRLLIPGALLGVGLVATVPAVTVFVPWQFVLSGTMLGVVAIVILISRWISRRNNQTRAQADQGQKVLEEVMSDPSHLAVAPVEFLTLVGNSSSVDDLRDRLRQSVGMGSLPERTEAVLKVMTHLQSQGLISGQTDLLRAAVRVHSSSADPADVLYHFYKAVVDQAFGRSIDESLDAIAYDRLTPSIRLAIRQKILDQLSELLAQDPGYITRNGNQILLNRPEKQWTADSYLGRIFPRDSQGVEQQTEDSLRTWVWREVFSQSTLHAHMMGEFSGRSPLMNFLLRTAVKMVDNGHGRDVHKLVYAHALFWQKIIGFESQGRGPNGLLLRMRDMDGGSAGLQKTLGFGADSLFLDLHLDELYRYMDNPVAQLLPELNAWARLQDSSSVTPVFQDAASDPYSVHALESLTAYLLNNGWDDRVKNNDVDRRIHSLAQVFRQAVQERLAHHDEVVAEYAFRVGLKKAFLHLLIPFPMHQDDSGWRAYFRYWGDDRFTSQVNPLSRLQILRGVSTIWFQKKLHQDVYRKGASAWSDRNQLLFWQSTFAVWGVFTLGLWVSITQYLLSGGMMAEFSGLWFLTVGASLSIVSLFSVVTYPAITHLMIGTIAWWEGKRKRATVVRSFWSWPTRRLEKTWAQVQRKDNGIDLESGLSWSDKWEVVLRRLRAVGRISDAEYQRLRLGDFSQQPQVKEARIEIKEFMNKALIRQPGLDVWEKLKSLTQLISAAGDAPFYYYWDAMIVPYGQQWDTRLHFITTKKKREWLILLEDLEQSYSFNGRRNGTREPVLEFLKALKRLEKNKSLQWDSDLTPVQIQSILADPNVRAAVHRVEDWFNRRYYANFRLVDSMQFERVAYFDYAQNAFYSEPFQRVRYALTGVRIQRTVQTGASRRMSEVLYATDQEAYDALRSMTPADRKTLENNLSLQHGDLSHFMSRYAYYELRVNEKLQIILRDDGLTGKTSRDQNGNVTKIDFADVLTSKVLRPLLGLPLSNAAKASTQKLINLLSVNGSGVLDFDQLSDGFEPAFAAFQRDVFFPALQTYLEIIESRVHPDTLKDDQREAWNYLKAQASLSINDPVSLQHTGQIQVLLNAAEALLGQLPEPVRESVRTDTSFQQASEVLRLIGQATLKDDKWTGVFLSNLSPLRDYLTAHRIMRDSGMEYVFLDRREAVEGVKYGGWGRVFNRVRGQILQGVDSLQEIPVHSASKLLRVMSEFSRDPRVALYLNAIQGNTDYFGSVPAAAYLAESTWNLTGQRAKQVVDILGAYGKFFAPMEYMVRYEGLQTDLVSEDIATAFQFMNYGLVTKFDEFFEMWWRTAPNLFLFNNPSGNKYPAGQTEYQAVFALSYMRWVLNSDLPPSWKWGMAHNSWHYYKKPFVVATIAVYILFSMLLKWNLFLALPSPWVMTGVGVLYAEAINLSALVRSWEREGALGVAQNLGKILFFQPLFVLAAFSNALAVFAGGKGSAKFIPTVKAGESISTSVLYTIKINDQPFKYEVFGEPNVKSLLQANAFRYQLFSGLILMLGIGILMPQSFSYGIKQALFILTALYWAIAPYFYLARFQFNKAVARRVIAAIGLFLANQVAFGYLAPYLNLSVGGEALGIWASIGFAVFYIHRHTTLFGFLKQVVLDGDSTFKNRSQVLYASVKQWPKSLKQAKNNFQLWSDRDSKGLEVYPYSQSELLAAINLEDATPENLRVWTDQFERLMDRTPDQGSLKPVAHKLRFVGTTTLAPILLAQMRNDKDLLEEWGTAAFEFFRLAYAQGWLSVDYSALFGPYAEDDPDRDDRQRASRLTQRAA